MHNLNLLSDKNLVHLGLTKEQVGRFRRAQPLGALVDLFFIDGMDAARLVPRLVSQGIFVSFGDLALFPADGMMEQAGEDENGEPAGGGQGNANGNDEDNDEAAPSETSTVLASGDGWTVESKAGDTLTPISDCETSKTFEVTGTKKGADGDYDHDYDEHKEPAESQATDGAKARMSDGIARIINKCECTDPKCPDQSLRIRRNPVAFTYSRRVRGSNVNGRRYRGWEARAVATATVTVTCVSNE